MDNKESNKEKHELIEYQWLRGAIVATIITILVGQTTLNPLPEAFSSLWLCNVLFAICLPIMGMLFILTKSINNGDMFSEHPEFFIKHKSIRTLDALSYVMFFLGFSLFLFNLSMFACLAFVVTCGVIRKIQFNAGMDWAEKSADKTKAEQQNNTKADTVLNT